MSTSSSTDRGATVCACGGSTITTGTEDRCPSCRRWEDEGIVPSTLLSARHALEAAEADEDTSIEHGRTLAMLRGLVADLEVRGGRHAHERDPHSRQYKAGRGAVLAAVVEYRGEVGGLLHMAEERLAELEEQDPTPQDRADYWRGYCDELRRRIAAGEHTDRAS